MKPVVVAAVTLGLAACRNTTAPTRTQPPPPDLRCSSSAIGLDTTVAGGLYDASACRARDPLLGETTFVRLYDLPVVAGQGYSVHMQLQAAIQSLLELTTPDSASPTLLAASGNRNGPADLLFIAPSTTTFRIRATTLAGLGPDTGAFTLLARTCRVPVPPVTDSITHSDSTDTADCQQDLSVLTGAGDHNLALVQLYQVHVTTDTMERLITFTASGPVRVFFGGPHADTFGQTSGTVMGYVDTASTHSAFYLAVGKGDYTLAIGGDAPVTATVTYTLTIGPEIPHP